MHIIPNKCIFLCSLLIILAISACSTKPSTTQTLSLEEYALNDALKTCKDAASEMTDGANGSGNPMWDSYFKMCMSSKGYKKEQYKHLRY